MNNGLLNPIIVSFVFTPLGVTVVIMCALWRHAFSVGR